MAQAPAPRILSWLPPTPSSGGDFAVCLSLANLYFLQAWAQLESGYLVYFSKDLRRPLVPVPFFAAALCDIFLLALIPWRVVTIVRRTETPTLKRALHLIFLVGLFVPLNILRTAYLHLSFAGLLERVGKAAAAALALVLAIAVLLAIRYWLGPVVHFLRFPVMALLPLMAFGIIQTVSMGFHKPPAPAAIGETALSLPVSSGSSRSEERRVGKECRSR